MKRCAQFWKDEEGFVVSSELILIATILVIGLITGLTTIRDQVVQELGDVADAVSEINQSYSYAGITAHSATTAQSVFLDQNDFCESIGPNPLGDQIAGNAPQCVSIVAAVIIGTE